MLFHYATHKISLICKISTFFEDLSFLNPRSHLNAKQRRLFEVIQKQSRDYMKNLSSKSIKNIKTFYIFLTGGAEVGKSHLIKTIYKSFSEVLMYKGGHTEILRILLLAPTGVAAIHIDGTTIHTTLRITVGSKLYPLQGRMQRF